MHNPFSIACYLALVDHHGSGWNEAHPSYLDEKFHVATSDEEYAYAMLDHCNQRRVLAYCKKWGLQLPPAVKQYEEELMR